jgi:hypothetical protein
MGIIINYVIIIINVISIINAIIIIYLGPYVLKILATLATTWQTV